MNNSTLRWAHQRSCTSQSRISLKATVKRSVPEGEKWHVCRESLWCVKSWHLPLLQLINFSTRSRETGKNPSGFLSLPHIKRHRIVKLTHISSLTLLFSGEFRGVDMLTTCYFTDDTCLLTQPLIITCEVQSDMTEVGFWCLKTNS